MEDTTVGLTIAAVLAVRALIKKKQAEASPIATPPLTAPTIIKPTGIEAPPLTAPSRVQPVQSVDTVSTTSVSGQQALSIGVSEAMLQKLQELTQAQATTPDTVIPTSTDRALLQTPVEAPKVSPTEPVIADFGKPIIGLVDRSVLSTAAAMGSFFSDIERSVRKELSRAETNVRQELSRVETGVRKELSRAETSVRKELSRFETSVRQEAGRFDRKIIRNLDPVKLVATVIGVIVPPIGVAMAAMDGINAYQEFAKAKTLAKRIEGEQAYANEVNSEITDIMSAPEKFAVTQEGGAIGYLAKKRINSAFVPLVEIVNPDFKDRFYTTIDMIPMLTAAKYQPSKIVGYISQIPFAGSTVLRLMYSFELLEFVVATDGSKYMQELVSNGYTEVKALGYVSMKPQEGPNTNRKLAEIEGVN